MYLRTNVDFKNNFVSLLASSIAAVGHHLSQTRTRASKYLSLCEILCMKLQTAVEKKNCLAQHGCLTAEGGVAVTE